MNTDKLLKYYCWACNRSMNQTMQLMDLCDNDFERLMELTAKMKKHFVMYCPATKDEVTELLKLKLD